MNVFFKSFCRRFENFWNIFTPSLVTAMFSGSSIHWSDLTSCQDFVQRFSSMSTRLMQTPPLEISKTVYTPLHGGGGRTLSISIYSRLAPAVSRYRSICLLRETLPPRFETQGFIRRSDWIRESSTGPMFGCGTLQWRLVCINFSPC